MRSATGNIVSTDASDERCERSLIPSLYRIRFHAFGNQSVFIVGNEFRPSLDSINIFAAAMITLGCSTAAGYSYGRFGIGLSSAVLFFLGGFGLGRLRRLLYIESTNVHARGRKEAN